MKKKRNERIGEAEGAWRRFLGTSTGFLFNELSLTTKTIQNATYSGPPMHKDRWVGFGSKLNIFI